VVAVLADAHEHPIVPRRRQYLWCAHRTIIFAVGAMGDTLKVQSTPFV
jgi:hypothetical protein